MKRTFPSRWHQRTAVWPVRAASPLALSVLLTVATPAEASEQGAATVDAREQLRHQERERALEQQNAP